MKVSVDSSALAKRYVEEAGSGRLEELLHDASELAFCVLLVPEIISGLNRRLREGELSTDNYREIKRRLLDDMRDSTVLQITPAVVARSIKLLEASALRAMDALHVACALEWNADLFVTADERQFSAAVGAGLRSERLG